MIITELSIFSEEDAGMMIRNMFAEDINRQINGVIKVDQDKVTLLGTVLYVVCMILRAL